MKSLKRILSSILAVIILLSTIPSFSVTASSESDFSYTVLDDGTLEITKYNGTNTDVKIPSTINGKKVTSIGSYMFYVPYKGESTVTSIDIPEGITNLGDAVFVRCSSLKTIILPKSINSIGRMCFFDLGLLTIKYCGSLERWSSILLGESWDSYSRITKEYNYIRDGEEIKYNDQQIGSLPIGATFELGRFPQSQVNDDILLTKLNSIATNDHSYKYQYYDENEICCELKMYYSDIILEGEKYRKVYFEQYRPYWPFKEPTKDFSSQDDNGYYSSKIYWFKWDPIVWLVVEKNSDGTYLVSRDIIDAMPFNNEDPETSIGWYNSSMKQWLNETFYNSAFSSNEKQSLTMDVLLMKLLKDPNDLNSRTESLHNLNQINNKIATPTDYAKSQGATSYWWLRDYGSMKNSFYSVSYNGRIGTSYCDRTDVGVRPFIAVDNKTLISPSDPVEGADDKFEVKLNLGVDRFTFGKDMSGYVGEEIRSLLVYNSKDGNIASLDITSSNPDIVEIGEIIELGKVEDPFYGDSIGQNEHEATVTLKLKAEGTSTIIITSPEGISTSVLVHVKKSSYEIKLYSEIPAMIVGKGKQIGAAVQLENNGVVVDGNKETAYSFASSNANIVTLSEIRKESDGTYFVINGINEGEAVITITENNTGAVFSGIVQVNSGILTFNAEALPSYYNRDNEYNGYIGGMYIDEFKMTEKDKDTMSVTFNVYNTSYIVGSVDVYDKDGNILRSEQIKRFDGGYVTSIKDTLISGYKLIEDTFFTGNLLTYKQDNYSTRTSISFDIPKGGHIEITNDPLYSNTCAIYNLSEFVVSSILMFGDVIDIDAKTQKEVTEIAGKNIVDKFLKEYIAALSGKTANEKIIKLGEKFINKLTEKSIKGIMKSSITGELSTLVDEGKAIMSECDINLEEIIISSAGSIGYGIAEGTLKKAMGPFGEVLNGMFKFTEYASFTNFLVDICKPHGTKSLNIYVDDTNGCLSNNGVSIKAENGTIDLSKSNYVMHSVVLSNKKDLTGAMKSSLDSISDEYVVRNIYLERDGKISQPNQPVQVTIPVPKEWISDFCKLYWVQEDGTLTEIQAMSSYNNLVFTTDHFSYYAIVYDTHNFGEWRTTKAATCTTDGVQTRTCFVCGETETKAIAKLGHSYSTEWTIDVPATCTAVGSKSHHCTRCDAKTDITEIEKLAHKFGEWRTTKAATCTTDGVQTRTCSVCGETETKAIAKLGHNYSTEWTIDIEATCTAVGSKSHHCTRCDAKTDVTEIEKLAHTFGEWTIVTEPTVDSEGEMKRVCLHCSAEETKKIDKLVIDKPVYLLGDVNNDGRVTAADARLALRISAKLEAADDMQFLAADVDKNNKITAADARKILRVSAKLDEF